MALIPYRKNLKNNSDVLFQIIGTIYIYIYIYIYIQESYNSSWFNYSDGSHFGTGVSIWYPLLKKCQLHPNFWKIASIRSLSDGVD